MSAGRLARTAASRRARSRSPGNAPPAPTRSSTGSTPRAVSSSARPEVFVSTVDPAGTTVAHSSFSAPSTVWVGHTYECPKIWFTARSRVSKFRDPA